MLAVAAAISGLALSRSQPAVPEDGLVVLSSARQAPVEAEATPGSLIPSTEQPPAPMPPPQPAPAATTSPKPKPTASKSPKPKPSPSAASKPPAKPAPAPEESSNELGVFTVTCYTLTSNTATGAKPYVGVAAVDRSIIPLGSRFRIDGVGEFVAGDTGAHGRLIDIWMADEGECISFGRQRHAVTLL